MGISLATPFQKKKINSRVAIWRGRRIQPTTRVPAGLRAIVARQTPVWKKVDDAFWTKFQTVSSGQELNVKSCYAS